MKELFFVLCFLMSVSLSFGQIVSERILNTISDTSVSLNIGNIGLVDSSKIIIEGHIFPHKITLKDTMFISFFGDDLSYSHKMIYFKPSLSYAEESKIGKLSNGNHYILGFGQSLLPEEVSYIYNEFDSEGNRLIDSVGVPVAGESVYGAAMLGEDGFYRTGMIKIDGKPMLFIDKCNRFAGVEWTKTYSVCADTETFSTDMYIDPLGNLWNRLIIVNSSEEYSYVMVKTDKDGEMIWKKTCDLDTYSNTFDASGNFYCISNSNNTGCEIKKYDPDFNLVQTKTIETSYPYSKFREIFHGPSGLVLGGMMKETEGGPYKAILLETDENLNTARVNISTFEFEGLAMCTKFFMDKNKLIYAYYIDKLAIGTNVNFLLFSLKQTTTGVADEAATTDLRIWPNPIGSSIAITIPGAYSGAAHVSILNSIGYCVRSESVQFESGTATTGLGKDLPQGMYFVRVSTPLGQYISKAIKAD